MPFTKIQGVGSGRVGTALDIFAGQPVLSDEMDVQTLETISLRMLYTRGGASAITALNIAIEASYDAGATFVPAVANKDASTPPDVTVAPGAIIRAVAATDDIAIGDIDVKDFALIRFSITATGAPAAGDLIDLDAFGLMSGSLGLSGDHAGQ